MDIDQLIYKKLSGTANDKEIIELIEWLKKDEKNKLIYQAIEADWKGEENKVKDYKKDVWGKLEGRIHDAQNINFDAISNTKKSKSFIVALSESFYKVAAVLLILITATFFVYFFNADNSNLSEIPVKDDTLITKYNPAGIKSTIVLPDKSKVKLNADSKLIFPESFTGQYRKVILDGEAFFDVTENPEKPFIVVTKNLTTEVKGTSFNINAYDENIYVAVESGLVSTYKNNVDGLYIQPGEMAIYKPNAKSSYLTKRQFKADEIAWKEGVMVFDNSSFQEVKETLMRWYGVEIILKRDIKFEKGINGNYKNATLKSVMESISYAGKFEYKIDYKNDQLTIW